MYDTSTRNLHRFAVDALMRDYEAKLDICRPALARLLLVDPDKKVCTDDFVAHRVMLQALKEECGPDVQQKWIELIHLDKIKPAAARKQIDITRIMGLDHTYMTHEFNCLGSSVEPARQCNIFLKMLEHAGTGHETQVEGIPETSSDAGERRLYAAMKSDAANPDLSLREKQDRLLTWFATEGDMGAELATLTLL
jgi:hypothetical protein